MRTLPEEMIRALAPFAPRFSKRVWRHVQVLVAGAILALLDAELLAPPIARDGLGSREAIPPLPPGSQPR